MIGKRSIWIGFDPREKDAFLVCKRSMQAHMAQDIPQNALVLDMCRAWGFYWRPTEIRDGHLWDVISEAPMSTEFAISRFLTPIVAETGWAVFCDCDFMFRTDIANLFALADPRYAVMVVKHKHRPKLGIKMDGQAQTAYPRKNWSSLALWNCDHPATKALTLEMVNILPGRDLHSFSWIPAELIGELPQSWNHLIGVNPPDPATVHFTLGTPDMPGYENSEYAEEWRAWLSRD